MLKESQRALKVARMPLTRDSLIQAVAKQPQVLIINCHGSRDKNGDHWLMFESQSKPTE